MPAPSAFTARSITWIASLSPRSSAARRPDPARQARALRRSFISLNRSVLRPLLDELADVLFHRRAGRP